MAGFTSNYNGELQGVAYNDLYLDSNGILANILTNTTEIEETCYHAIQLCANDWDFNTLLGTPWNTYLNSPVPVGAQMQLSIVNALEGVTGVDNVASVDFYIDANRILQVIAVINLTNNNQLTINVGV